MTTTYRAGQRVRIEWPEGTAIEGVLAESFSTQGKYLNVIYASGQRSMWFDKQEMENYITGEATVTILSEPRPDEPTGLGAVVEDELGGRWVRTYPHCREAMVAAWREVLPGTYLEDDAQQRRWDQIDNPHTPEGWTP